MPPRRRRYFSLPDQVVKPLLFKAWLSNTSSRVETTFNHTIHAPPRQYEILARARGDEDTICRLDSRCARISETGRPTRTIDLDLKKSYLEDLKLFKHLSSLVWRTREITRLFKFMLVGASGIVINEGLLYVFTEFAGMFYLVSSVIAVQCAILNNFVWNHIWTFYDRRGNKVSILHRLGKFELVSISGKLTNILVLYLAVTFLGIQYLIANLLGIAAGFVVNFTVNNIWTWRR